MPGTPTCTVRVEPKKFPGKRDFCILHRTRGAATRAPLKNKTPRRERGRCYPTPTASPRGVYYKCKYKLQTLPNHCHCCSVRRNSNNGFHRHHLRIRSVSREGTHTPKRYSHRLVILREPAVILFSQRTPDRILFNIRGWNGSGFLLFSIMTIS